MNHMLRRSVGRVVPLVVLCGAIVAGCYSTNRTGPSSSGGNDRTYDQVIESRTIRVGYVIYPPAVIQKPGSDQITGVFADALVTAGKNMGLEVKFVEEASFGTMIEGLESGRYDVVCSSIWANGSRGKVVDFTVPLYYSALGVYARADDHRFDENLAAINSADVAISTIDGEITVDVAKQHFPTARVVSLPQATDSSMSLLNVVERKADIAFAEPHLANLFLKNNPGTIRNVVAGNPIRVFPNVMLVRKGDSRFLATLNAALTELLNSGEIDQLLTKYFPDPASYHRVARPYRVD